MTYCSKCGAAQPEGAKFCTECGAPLSSNAGRTLEIMPQMEYHPQKETKRRKRKPLFRRWWIWALAIIIVVAVAGKRGGKKPSQSVPRQVEVIAPAEPVATPRPTVKPTAAPAPTVAPTLEVTAAPAGVSPEFKASMDSYEAFFDEYIDFMKAMSEDPSNMTMLLRYTAMMAQYSETMEKLDAIDESKLSPADDAYYIEVMARIEVKLMQAAQYMQ